MLASPDSTSSPTADVSESRAQRRQRLLQQLQALTAPLLEQMADTLIDSPDRELFRSIKVRLCSLGQQVAAAAQQTGLDDRKKGVPRLQRRLPSLRPRRRLRR